MTHQILSATKKVKFVLFTMGASKESISKFLIVNRFHVNLLILNPYSNRIFSPYTNRKKVNMSVCKTLWQTTKKRETYWSISCGYFYGHINRKTQCLVKFFRNEVIFTEDSKTHKKILLFQRVKLQASNSSSESSEVYYIIQSNPVAYFFNVLHIFWKVRFNTMQLQVRARFRKFWIVAPQHIKVSRACVHNHVRQRSAHSRAT